ncbi:MAG: hypothetical protein ACO25F_10000 [Erythrobacter sp.]
MIRKTIVSAIALLASAPALGQPAEDKVTPLFAEDSVLALTLDGPIKELVRSAERSTDPYPATLQVAGEQLAVEIAARGVSRRKRENCRFPPMRLSLMSKPGETSLFHKQGRLKRVTHCRDQASYDQTVMREYTAYRLYNVVTPESLKVRLAKITYADAGQPIATRLAFMIEDADDAARRLGLKEVDSGNFKPSALNAADAARNVVFQYLIGNTDWDMTFGPDPTDCCHNSKVLGAAKDATSDLTPLPYDFDNSGLVDAPYAIPNAILNIRTVKTRVYRGYCSLNPLIPGEAARLRELRPALEAAIRGIPELDSKARDEMLAYLASGFADIADDALVARNLTKKCR